MIKIFVETRGTSEVYYWFDLQEGSKQQLLKLSDSVKNLVDTEFESLVLYRESRQLILAITALKSGRTDNRTRPIRNSLIWIADNDEEAKIRAIIYEYLTNKESLEKQIAEAITETPEIKIDYQKIKSVGDEIQVKSASLPPSNVAYKIGNLDQYKQDLSKEIEQYNLPENKGLLIFITDSKLEDKFKEIYPWRGLSNKINGGWITLGNKKPVVNEKKTKKQTSQISTKSWADSDTSLTKSKKTERKQLNLFSIILALLLVSNAFLLYQNNQLHQDINDLKQQNHEQQTEINHLKQNIKKIEDLQAEIKKSNAEVKKLKTDLETNIRNANSKFEEAQKQFEEAQKQFEEAQKQFEEAQKQFNDDINSIKQITSTNSPSDEGEMVSKSR